MSTLHETFTNVLAAEYPNKSFLDVISNVLLSFRPQDSFVLEKKKLRDRTLFCCPNSLPVCLELFTSSILFRTTGRSSNLPRNHIDSFTFSIDRTQFKGLGKTFTVKQNSYRFVSLPNTAWEYLHLMPTPMDTRRLRVPRSLSGRETYEHLQLASSSEIYRGDASTVHPPPIFGFMVLFISDQIHTVTISRCDNDDEIKLDIPTTKPPAPLKYLEFSYSTVTAQYTFYSKGEELHAKIGGEESRKLTVPAPSGSRGQTTQHTYGRQSSSSQAPDYAPVDLMLDLSIRDFVFPTLVMAPWLTACEIHVDVNENPIKKLADSECQHSFKILDAHGKTVLELPVSTLKDSSGRIRLLASSETTSIILGIPLLELYDINIYKAGKKKGYAFTIFSSERSERQEVFRGSFALKTG